MDTIELTRKELYAIVWSTPLSKLKQQYAFTNDEIKKICKEFEIPMPDNSYWSKLKFNKPINKTELNTVFGGEDKITLTIREEGNPVNIDQTPLTIKTIEIKNDPKAPLTVPDKLTKPDILIQNTKELYSKRKDRPYYWDKKIDSVSIDVDDANFDRAIRIMDTFVKLLRYRGHTFKRDRNNSGPDIIVNEVEFSFRLREVQKRVPATTKYFSSTYAPTGIFVMKINESYKAKEWKDGSVKLENQLAKIVAKIELEAVKELEWREECRLHKIQREEEKNRLAEIKKHKDDEVDKFNRLVKLSEQYDKTLLIRQYIEARKQKAIDTNSLTPEKQEWIRWATDKSRLARPTNQ
jgi:hypothetical protein